MNCTVDEMMALSQGISDRDVRIANLERQLKFKEEECTSLRMELDALKLDHAATTIENMLLKNYIMLSVEKIRKFVSNLNNIDRFSFLKTFMEWVLPHERYTEQLKLVNEVMVLPCEQKGGWCYQKQLRGDDGTGCDLYRE